MGLDVSTTEPNTLRAGTTWRWRLALDDFPSDVWTLTYHFRSASAYFDVVAVPDGTAHLVTVSAAVTTTYAPGGYDWYLLADNGSDRHEIGQGRVEVLPDVTTGAALDGRVWARKALEAVEAVLLNRATKDQLDLLTVAAGDRSVTRDRNRLLELRAKLLIEVQRTEGTGGRPQRILASFR